jgi:sugar/nucleoside kinase (ribokinase family)
MTRSVLAVGDANIDILLTGLPGMPLPEQEVLAQRLEVAVGGQTSTFARALCRLGIQVVLIAKVGSDEYGREVIRQLRQDGVDTSAILIDPDVRTGITIVLSSGTQRAFATYRGSVCRLQKTEVESVGMAGAGHLHVGSYYLLEALRPDVGQLFGQAKQLGLTTSLDPGWDPKNEWGPDILQALRHVDVFLPNRVEAMSISQSDTPEKALEGLGEYAGTVVVKAGGDGCLVWDRGQIFASSGFEVPVKDVTSAGDVFNAGFIYGFLQRWDARECARFANACGAISVGETGSLGIVSGVDQVEHFLISRGSCREAN